MKNRIPLKTDIRIDTEGLWFYRGLEMTRRDIVQFFYQNLAMDESGRHSIQIGRQIYPVEVEDTAYVVWNIRAIPGKGGSEDFIELVISDYSLERLNPATIRIDRNNIPYCSIRNGLYKARFCRPAYYQLAALLQHNPESDGFYLELNDCTYDIETGSDHTNTL